MAERYPMPRAGRRRSAHRLFRQTRLSWRMLVLALVAMVVLGASVAAVRRSARPDSSKLLAAARITFATGNYHAAQSNARGAIAAGASGVEAHLLLARSALMLDDGAAAEAALDRAGATGAAPAALGTLRAHARLLQGDAQGALARTSGAFGPYALRIRARALAASDDPAGAHATLEELVAARPNDGAAWTDLARLRLTLGDVGGAAQAIDRAVTAARGEPATLTLAGEVVRTRFGLAAALPWFAAALKRDAYYHPALIEQAATLGDLGRYRDMLAATRRATIAEPGSPQALYLQAVLAARADRVDLARRLIQLTGGALDGVPGVLLLSGSLDFRRGDYDQAVANWRRLVDAQPMNVAARRLLALALLRSGDPRGSLEVLRPMVLRADADAYTLRLAARGLERVGDRAAAALMLDRAARGGGDSAPFASDTAIGALAAAAADAASDPTYQIGLVRGLIGAGDAPAAIARARALVVASPGAAPARLALGDALVAAGRRKEAVQAYARAADLAFDGPTMLRLVDALGRGGAAKDAAATMSLYLQQNRQATEARRILGHWQVQAGDYSAAVTTLEAIRRATGSRDAGLLADLAFAYAGMGEPTAALRYGRAAYTLAPANADASQAYAVGLEAAGDTIGARQLAGKARAVAGAATTS